MSLRGGDASSLAKVLGDLVETYKLRAPLDEARLRICWDNLMGDAVAAQTESFLVSGQKLMVRISDASLRSELHLNQSDIIERLNACAGISGRHRISRLLFI
ncbi:MAG: DUF721 domain-containing protein [Sphingomonadales bacterium]|nr:DUF721 domain-containing protein [Sphingomonadales bacterium]